MTWDPSAIRKLISIHAPRMGSDSLYFDTGFRRARFQSTLPGWGATADPRRLLRQVPISIHAPRMGSDRIWWVERCDRHRISIHAPRMGSDAAGRPCRTAGRDFNPRSPDGERLQQQVSEFVGYGISIHAPRMGSDLFERVWRGSRLIFQSTLPGWGATAAKREAKDAQEFQSTLPGWGATGAVFLMRGLVVISIHAPRMGSDSVTVYVP
ncbi:hypothetical protein NRBB04_1387 [Bifidobacterium breve]|nr:hypothetical protein NRBB04_1387 [Bifidobacterium breve]